MFFIIITLLCRNTPRMKPENSQADPTKNTRAKKSLGETPEANKNTPLNTKQRFVHIHQIIRARQNARLVRFSARQ